MAVVVNEFEVIPAEPPARDLPGRTEGAQPDKKPRDAERELNRLLYERRARELRLMAV